MRSGSYLLNVEIWVPRIKHLITLLEFNDRGIPHLIHSMMELEGMNTVRVMEYNFEEPTFEQSQLLSPVDVDEFR